MSASEAAAEETTPKLVIDSIKPPYTMHFTISSDLFFLTSTGGNGLCVLPESAVDDEAPGSSIGIRQSSPALYSYLSKHIALQTF